MSSKWKIEIGKECIDSGVDFVAEKYNITRETAKRYKRIYEQSTREMQVEHITSKKNTILQKIAERYSDKELKQIADGKLSHKENKKHVHEFNGDKLKIGVIADTHIGSKYTDYEYIFESFDMFNREDVDFICHAGDVTEGISHRQGHVYECSEIGYEAQKEKSIEILNQWDDTAIYLISGNHDNWGRKALGANVVKDICNNVENAIFLGDDEGDIIINDTTIRLWHGLDGSSYAHSYRLQKIIESFTGGEKPHCLIAGHCHKALYTYDRHVHCVSAGCMQSQSSWMRGKRLPAHTGFWIIEMVLNEKGIARFKPEFFPFYA